MQLEPFISRLHPYERGWNLRGTEAQGIIYSGKRLLDYLEDVVKMAYFLPDDDPTKDWYRDFMWYLWCGPKSPVYGKDNMATFENYFVADKAAAKENMNRIINCAKRGIL